MTPGRCKWFSAPKGFGFIESFGSESFGDDIFVHYSSIQGTGYLALNEGDEVEFDIEQAPKGRCAKNVRVVRAAAVEPAY